MHANMYHDKRGALLLFTSRTPQNNGVVIQYRYPNAAPSISRDFPSSCASTRHVLRLQPKSEEAVFCDDKPLTSEEVQQILSSYDSFEEDSSGIIQPNLPTPLVTISGDVTPSRWVFVNRRFICANNWRNILYNRDKNIVLPTHPFSFEDFSTRALL